MLKTSSRVISNPVNQQHQATVITRFCEGDLLRQSLLIRYTEVSDVYEPRTAQSYRDPKKPEVAIPENTTLAKYKSKNTPVIDKEIHCDVEHFVVNGNNEVFHSIPNFFCEDGIALLTVLVDKWKEIGIIYESAMTGVCQALAVGSVGGVASVLSASVVTGLWQMPLAVAAASQAFAEAGLRYAIPKFFGKLTAGAWLGFSAVKLHVGVGVGFLILGGKWGYDAQYQSTKKHEKYDDLLKEGIKAFVDFCRPEGDSERIGYIAVAMIIGEIRAKLTMLIPDQSIREKSSVFRMLEESRNLVFFAKEHLDRREVDNQGIGA